MKDVVSEMELTESLRQFKCTKDNEIQTFLQEKAIQYEDRGWCSTYVLVNENKLEKEQKLFVEGYFSLSNKVIELSNSISKTKKKKLFNGLDKNDEYMHFILIGQLGKFIDEEGSKSILGEISGRELLNQAFEIIFQVKERIVCNCVLIECKDEVKVRKIYEGYGFQELQKEDGLVQYIKFI